MSKYVQYNDLNTILTEYASAIKDRIIQYSTMPIAEAKDVDRIVQYIGTTTETYTNGLFYKGAENSGIYSWEEFKIQDVSEKQNKTLDTSLTIDGTTATTVESALGTLNTKKIDISKKGSFNGLAELDETGKVPISQLPATMSQLEKYPTKSDFPAVGGDNTLYVALDTNFTYRWTGIDYVQIDESVQLGETATTAYRGDRGKIAYDHSQTTSGNPHNVTYSEVGAAAASHTHNLVKDIGNNNNTTFAYSKSALNYGDYTWLAGWNGYELRGVAKSQFAQASHTHNYAGSGSAGGAANYLTYLHTNEINFKGGAQSTCYFNYRNAETDSAAAVNAITYKFCNYSNDSSKSTIDAANFTGTAANASKLSGYSASTSATGNTIAMRQGNGYLYATYFNQSSGAETPTSSSYVIYCNSDGFFRKSSIANMKSLIDTNTWRGIQNNLTSTSTSDSLSANQGRLLANGSARDSTKLPLSGGTVTGTITLGLGGGAVYNSGAASSGTTHITGSGFLNLRSPGIQCRTYTDGGWAGISASKFVTQSSRRYKENIEDISEEEANKLLDIRVVKFDYKENITDEEHRYNQHGVIAEETIEIIPEVVTCAIPYGQESQFDEPVPDSVDYSRFTPYLIKMIQMQQKEINELKSLVKELTQ